MMTLVWAQTHSQCNIILIYTIDFQMNSAPTKFSNKAYVPSTVWSTAAHAAAMASRAMARAL
jgi:hypothetical protein